MQPKLKSAHRKKNHPKTNFLVLFMVQGSEEQFPLFSAILSTQAVRAESSMKREFLVISVTFIPSGAFPWKTTISCVLSQLQHCERKLHSVFKTDTLNVV